MNAIKTDHKTLDQIDPSDIKHISFDHIDPMQLDRARHTYQAARDRLLALWPDIDSDTLADTLEGITDLHEMIAVVIRSALVDEALGSGLRGRLADMKERQSRLEMRASKKRELALQAMSEVGLTKLVQADFTASTRAGVPALVVVSEQSIPASYWLTQPPKLDRQGLLGELTRGGAIPGVELSNPKPVLMVRTK
jgi:Siphovirus Gp157